MNNLKNILLFKNKALLFSFILIDIIVVFHLISIIYAVMIDSSVSFTNGFTLIQGIIAVGICLVIVLITNTINTFLAISRIRSIWIAIFYGIIIGLTIYFLSTLGALFATLGAPLYGVLIGLYYTFVFFGPAIWAYYRFRLVHLSVAWLSILHLSTLLILIAGGLGFSIDGLEKSTLLLRPDLFIISAVFYLLVLGLLINDNKIALGNWKRTPGQNIGLKKRTVIPVLIILVILTIVTNFASPFLWKVVWERSQEQGKEQNDSHDKVNKPDGSGNDGKDGSAGNINKESNKSTMNPNQKLESKIDGGNKNGKPNVLLLVNTLDINDKPVSKYGLRYWKLDVMEEYTQKDGYQNSYKYTGDSQAEYQTSYLSYSDSYYGLDQARDLVVFTNLEENNVIGSEKQLNLELVNTAPRYLYEEENGIWVTEKSKPWTIGESYIIKSQLRDYVWESKYEQNTLDYVTDEYYDEEIIDTYTDFQFDSDIDRLTKSVLENAGDSQLEKALAIQDYFLKNYKYSLDAGTPTKISPNTESLDRMKYFLFTSKKGYCLYYATAMVSMLRSADIPARVVGGFASNAYSKDVGAYVITDQDAHAWVEVYFGYYGWITFDPTPSNPAGDMRDEKNKSSADKKLTKEEKAKLKDLNKNAKDKIDAPAKPVETPNSEYDEELQKQLAAFFAELGKVIEFIFKYVLTSCCCLLVLGFAAGVPFWNYMTKQYLLGKVKKFDDVTQIKMLFKLLERTATRINRKYAMKKSATSFEYAEILEKAGLFEGEEQVRALKEFAEIYNRAVFRFKIHENDLSLMMKDFEVLDAALKPKSSVIKWWLVN